MNTRKPTYRPTRHTPGHRVLEVCRVFNEIQTGPNPLTPAEIRKLINKRPHLYGVLEANATPKVAAP